MAAVFPSPTHDHGFVLHHNSNDDANTMFICVLTFHLDIVHMDQ